MAGGEFLNFPSAREVARSIQLDLNAPRGQVSGSGETFRAVRTLVSGRVPSFFMFSRPSYRRWDGGPSGRSCCPGASQGAAGAQHRIHEEEEDEDEEKGRR